MLECHALPKWTCFALDYCLFVDTERLLFDFLFPLYIYICVFRFSTCVLHLFGKKVKLNVLTGNETNYSRYLLPTFKGSSIHILIRQNTCLWRMQAAGYDVSVPKWESIWALILGVPFNILLQVGNIQHTKAPKCTPWPYSGTFHSIYLRHLCIYFYIPYAACMACLPIHLA